jgi:hypothetical protein
MLDFNWGIFWAILAAFAIRGVWRATVGEWMKRENERVRQRRNMSLDE